MKEKEKNNDNSIDDIVKNIINNNKYVWLPKKNIKINNISKLHNDIFESNKKKIFQNINLILILIILMKMNINLLKLI